MEIMVIMVGLIERVGARFFRGQKPTDYGHCGGSIDFAVCYSCNRNLHTKPKGGYLMRHFYFRLILGIVWLAVAAVSAVKANISFAVLYAVLGMVFLWSAYSVWKKEKGQDKRG